MNLKIVPKKMKKIDIKINLKSKRMELTNLQIIKKPANTQRILITVTLIVSLYSLTIPMITSNQKTIKFKSKPLILYN